jgi:bacterioferritin-associated ferredoxin
MIVCSCNVLSDTDVRTVANTATRRTTSYVYSCLGCRARCGRCARTIREIMDEVFDGAKAGRADGGAVLAAPRVQAALGFNGAAIQWHHALVLLGSPE